MRGEWHLPGHNFTGPGTRLTERLERGDEPVNRVDALSLHHDIRYLGITRATADDGMLNFTEDYEILNADVNFVGGAIGIFFDPRSTMQERSEAALVGSLMTVKIAYNFLPIGRAFTRFKRFSRLKGASILT